MVLIREKDIEDRQRGGIYKDREGYMEGQTERADTEGMRKNNRE